MVNSVPWLDDAFHASRLDPASIELGRMNGNIDNPTVEIIPTLASDDPANTSACRRAEIPAYATTGPRNPSTGADLFAALAAQDSRTAPDLAAGDATGRLLGDVAALEDLVIRRPTPWAGWTAALIGVALVAPAGWPPAILLAVLLALLPAGLARAAARLTQAPAKALATAAGDLQARLIAYAESRAEIAAYGLAPQVTADLAAMWSASPPPASPSASALCLSNSPITSG